MKTTPGRRSSQNVCLAVFLTLATLITASCLNQKSITTATPESGAQQYVEALQKLDMNAVKTLTCLEYRRDINNAILENGNGNHFGIHSNLEAKTSDISALTYTTIWINSDDDRAHVHINGIIKIADSDEVNSVDTIRFMKKEDGIWMECGVVNQ